MQNGAFSALPKPAPRTAVAGSTWSRNEYPTPTANEYGTSQNEGKVEHKRATAGTPSLKTWARRWPTPLATDSESTARHTTTAEAMNPGTTLTDAGRQWATPTARDGRRPGPINPRKHTKGGRSLEADVVQWATPLARDHRSTQASAETHAKNTRPLSEQAGSWDSRQDPKTSKAGKSGSPPMVLNPAFVAALMGLPIEWTGFASRAMEPFHNKPRSRGALSEVDSMDVEAKARADERKSKLRQAPAIAEALGSLPEEVLEALSSPLSKGEALAAIREGADVYLPTWTRRRLLVLLRELELVEDAEERHELIKRLDEHPRRARRIARELGHSQYFALPLAELVQVAKTAGAL